MTPYNSTSWKRFWRMTVRFVSLLFVHSEKRKAPLWCPSVRPFFITLMRRRGLRVFQPFCWRTDTFVLSHHFYLFLRCLLFRVCCTWVCHMHITAFTYLLYIMYFVFSNDWCYRQGCDCPGMNVLYSSHSTARPTAVFLHCGSKTWQVIYFAFYRSHVVNLDL